jgi:protein kinase A/protein kinase X
MLFEFIQGGELFSCLTKNGRFNNDCAVFYVAGILDAIIHLHSMDIVFRDLKPENIMVDSEGYPKLIDMGFAKKMHGQKTSTICGTPEYLAPEMLDRKSKGYTKVVDYWGIGILAYELLVGYPPFYYNDDPNNIYKKIKNAVIEFPEFIGLRARHLILQLLNPNPSRRLGARDNGK